MPNSSPKVPQLIKCMFEIIWKLFIVFLPRLTLPNDTIQIFTYFSKSFSKSQINYSLMFSSFYFC